jgi:hypothetical protein
MTRGAIRRWSAGASLVYVCVATVATVLAPVARDAGAQDERAFPHERFAPVLPSSVDGDTAIVALAAQPIVGEVGVSLVAPVFRPDTSADVQSTVEVLVGSPGGESTVVSPSTDAAPPPQSGVWATSVGRQVTPVFSYDSLVGPGVDGALAGSSWGTVTGFGVAQPGAIAVAAPSPSLAMVNRAIEVSTTEALPATILDQPVVAVDDFVRLAYSESTATTSTDFIRVDRTNGQIQLLEASDGTLVDVSGDRSWIGRGLPAVSTDPGTLSFDLPAVAALVGLEAGDDTLAVSVDRTFGLADGRVVTVYGVAATLGWFARAAEEAAGVPEVLATTTIPAPEGEAAAATDDAATASEVLPALVAVAVLLVAVAVIVLVARARRRRPARRRASSARSSPDEALAAFDAQMASISARQRDSSSDQSPAELS